jgi:hypothetical protein
MSSEALQVEMGKRERERERERGKGGGGFYTPLTPKRVVTTLRPGMSGENPGSSETPENPGYSSLPRSAPKKISL